MEIFQLKEFKSLAGTLSFSETAYRLNVSTSSLSRHIQQLEAELGEELFERTSRSIVLTQFGLLFLPHAVRILQEYDDGMETIRRYQEERKMSLTMGVSYSSEEYMTASYITDFQREYPNCTVRIVTGSMTDMEKGFREGLFNVYTAINNDRVEGMKFVKVGDNYIKAVVSAESSFARRSSAALADLVDSDLYIPAEGSIYYDRIMQFYKDNDLTPTVMYTGRFEECRDFLRVNKKGVALFPFRAGRPLNYEGLVFLDIDPPLNFEYGIGHRKNISTAESLIVNHIRKLAEARRFVESDQDQ